MPDNLRNLADILHRAHFAIDHLDGDERSVVADSFFQNFHIEPAVFFNRQLGEFNVSLKRHRAQRFKHRRMFDCRRKHMQVAKAAGKCAHCPAERHVVGLGATTRKEYFIRMSLNSLGRALARGLKLYFCCERLFVEPTRVAIYIKEARKLFMSAKRERSSRCGVRIDTTLKKLHNDCILTDKKGSEHRDQYAISL